MADEPTPYQRLLREAAAASSEPEPDCARVEATLQAAVKLEPDNPLAHHMIAVTRGRLHDHTGASKAFVLASERYPRGSSEWAETTSAAFVRLTRKECAEVPKPGWWTDAALLELSERVVAAAPDSGGCWQMRATVLGAFEECAARGLVSSRCVPWPG